MFTSVIIADDQVVTLLKSHYSETFEIASKDINLEILKIKDIKNDLNEMDVKIISNYPEPKCGTQHAWLTILNDNRVIQKMPITLSISVFKDVWIADHKAL